MYLIIMIIILHQNVEHKTNKSPEHGSEHHQTQPIGNPVQLLSQDCRMNMANISMLWQAITATRQVPSIYV